jgi:hypothetical protein
VRFTDGLYKSLAPLQSLKTFNLKEIKKLVDLLINRLYFKKEEYKNVQIDKIIFSYMTISSKDVKNIQDKKDKNIIINKKSTSYKMFGYNLPKIFYKPNTSLINE